MDPHTVVEDWHRRRVARLQSVDGWLAITGRWEVGDEPVELPIGVATRAEGGVRIGEAVHPFGSTFTRGGQRWEVSHVAGGAIVRVRDPEAPALRAFRGIDRFPVDLGYRVQARIVKDAPPPTFTYASGARVAKSGPGRLAFTLHGVDYTLGASVEGKDRLFVLFGDATNGDSTYGAGRFVYVDWDGGDEVVLDFNQAFNPPCALTEFATCPLVADEDRLPVPVPAGEKYPLPA